MEEYVNVEEVFGKAHELDMRVKPELLTVEQVMAILKQQKTEEWA